MNIKNVQNKAITRGIYIGKNVTFLKINILYFKNKKSKCPNDANQDAPLIFDNAVQALEKAGNMTGGGVGRPLFLYKI